MQVDIVELQRWIGRGETRVDAVGPTPIAALSATLDTGRPLPVGGDVVPPLWHWLFFLPLHPGADLGPDGHARRGGFLPPVPLQRRMWAGGRFEFLAPLRVGDAIRRVSTIADVTAKDGRTGPLVFVVVRHEVFGPEGLALVEEHDIVYRGPAAAGAPSPAAKRAPPEPTFTREIVPDDVLLFRYSALTFNGHRIHYDRRYATEVEGYPGLVVHGPLLATLLAGLAGSARPDEDLAAFSFRALATAFDGSPVRICGRPGEEPAALRLWAETDDGTIAMEARAVLRPR
ncbi:FAS1-like dehydratase domain-containing protein [Lichenibacterium minor]|nr:MaoC family dehydratase N-terminal domain-containing protein [Lichenibacterium minor]